MKTYDIIQIDLEAEVDSDCLECTEVDAWYEVPYYDGNGCIRSMMVSDEKMNELFKNLIARKKIKLTDNGSIILLE